MRARRNGRRKFLTRRRRSDPVALNSFVFLLFFGLVTAVHYAAPHRWRWIILLLASVYFYSALEPAYLLLLAYTTGVAFVAGHAIARCAGRRAAGTVLGVGVVAELCALVAFKYSDFISASLEPVMRYVAWSGSAVALPRLGWILPAGLSFYTFSCIAYLVDVRRGHMQVERHLGRFALYVAFFPKLLAGPIERAKPFLSQLQQPVRFDRDKVTAGLFLVLWGLFKKVVIADRLAEFVDGSFKTVAAQSPMTLTIAVYLYAFQIYCDFSGYSDIAIGVARVLGIELAENFRRPYLARTTAEFWSQRWHISLSTWFRDYLYIPLGGRRVSLPRWYLNQLIVFAVSGLWHGANWTFLIWGGINGVLHVGHFAFAGIRRRIRDLLSVPNWLAALFGIAVTFHLIALGWIFFRASTVADAVVVLTKIAVALPQLATLATHYNWTSELMTSFGLIAVLMAVEALDDARPIWSRLVAAPRAIRWATCYALMIGLLLLGRWGTSQFVYMQF